MKQIVTFDVDDEGALEEMNVDENEDEDEEEEEEDDDDDEDEEDEELLASFLYSRCLLAE